MTSFGVTFFSIPAIIKVCSIKKLFDSPNQRKNHKRPTPTLGGLGIFAGFVFSITFWSKSLQITQLQYIICATLVIFFMGMKDDLINAGADYVDEDVVVDGNIVSSPHYRNNHQWVKAILN